MNWKSVLLLAGCGVMWVFFYGPVRAPLVEEISGQVEGRAGFPAGLSLAGGPLQRAVPKGTGLLQAGGFVFTPVAEYDVEGRVLSRRDYRLGRQAVFCPVEGRGGRRRRGRTRGRGRVRSCW